MPTLRHFLSLFIATLLVITCLASLASAQTRAADATAPGGLPFMVIDFSMPAANDAAVLPGCDPTVEPGFMCITQIAGRVYLPPGINKPDSKTYPIIILLHGNHPSCGRAYDPTKDRKDLMNNAGPRQPRIDDMNEFSNTGMCPAAPVAYTEVPSYEGYEYLGDRLAGDGYVVVSINANRGIALRNSAPGVVDDFGLIRARGRLVLRHLQILSGWNNNKGTSNPFLSGIDLFRKLDFTQVGLFGHSRGGEGVRAAYNLYSADPDGTDWRMRIGAVTFQAIFELAPTDIRRSFSLGMVGYDANDVAWNSLLPACDSDVDNLQGLPPFDRMLKEQSSFDRISTYLVWGANHNFYNTQWQTTDGLDTRITNKNPAPTCLSASNLFCVDPNVNFTDNRPLFANSILNSPGGGSIQQSTALSSVLALFRAYVGRAKNEMFDANFNPLVGVAGTVVNPDQQRFVYPSRCIERGYSRPPVSETVFEDFTQATGLNSHSTAGHPVHNARGNRMGTIDVEHENGVVTLNDPEQRLANITWTTRNPNDAPFFQDNWTTPGSSMDISSYATLDFRVARQVDPKANATTSTDFSIYLIGDPATAWAGPVKLSDALKQGFASLTGPTGEMRMNNQQAGTHIYHSYMETVRIRLSAFPNLARVQRRMRGVQFLFNQTTTGAIYLADITLSPDLGAGIPASASLPVAGAGSQSLTQSLPSLWEKPLIHSGSVAAMKRGILVYGIEGVPYADGVKLELTSDYQFPAGDAPMVLQIGPSSL